MQPKKRWMDYAKDEHGWKQPKDEWDESWRQPEQTFHGKSRGKGHKGGKSKAKGKAKRANSGYYTQDGTAYVDTYGNICPNLVLSFRSIFRCPSQYLFGSPVQHMVEHMDILHV